MVFNILNLPRNAFYRVCSFASDETLLRMRELCKKSKNIADFTLLTTRNAEVDAIMIYLRNNLHIMHFFGHHQRLPKSLLFVAKTIRTKLGELDHLRGNALEICTKTEDDLLTFLHQMKQKLCTTKIRNLHFRDCSSHMIRACAYIFEGASVSEVQMNFRELEDWHYLLQKVRPASFRCEVQLLDKETAQWLLKIADIVEVLLISDFGNCSTQMIITIAQAIMGRACKTLTIDWYNSASPNIEMILKYFHAQLGKKLSLSVVSDLASMNLNAAGYYRMRRGENDDERIVFIEHLDSNSPAL